MTEPVGYSDDGPMFPKIGPYPIRPAARPLRSVPRSYLTLQRWQSGNGRIGRMSWRRVKRLVDRQQKESVLVMVRLGL